MSVRVLCGLLLLVGVLAACGDPDAATPAPTGQTPPATGEPSEVAIAPDCDELVSERGADEPMPVSPPPPSFDPRDLQRWASAEPGFAGIWIDPPGSNRFTVAFTGDVEARRAEVHERFGEGVGVTAADHTMAELEALQEEIGTDAAEAAQDPDRDPHRPAPGTIVGSGIMPQIGRVSLGVVGGDGAALAALTARYGADRICLHTYELPAPMDPGGPVRPLAKASGWRDDGLLGDSSALVEIAYDRETAERAWDENVPEGLPEREGDPVEDGLYGTLDDVDFERQAVVVWSAGQSGSCPGWLADIETSGDEVRAEHGSAGAGACTDDYNPYRMVLAVDLDRLPPPGDLPLPPPTETPTGAAVRAYE
jgi:nucleotide-binding universal stress UspA family protein